MIVHKVFLSLHLRVSKELEAALEQNVALYSYILLKKM